MIDLGTARPTTLLELTGRLLDTLHDERKSTETLRQLLLRGHIRTLSGLRLTLADDEGVRRGCTGTEARARA